MCYQNVNWYLYNLHARIKYKFITAVSLLEEVMKHDIIQSDNKL